MKVTFAGAMIAYVALGILAGLTLDGPLRIAVWLLLIALAVKTWIADLKRRQP